MKPNKKYRIVENFGEFMRSTELHQTGEAAEKYDYGSNPDGEQMDLPFEFETSPEIGYEWDSVESKLETIQSLIDATLNVNDKVNSKGIELDPYIKRQIDIAHKSLKEAYLRMQDTLHRR